MSTGTLLRPPSGLLSRLGSPLPGVCYLQCLAADTPPLPGWGAPAAPPGVPQFLPQQLERRGWGIFREGEAQAFL